MSIKTGGAMKLTTDGRWVHIVCALYHDFPRFEDEVTMEPIKIPKKITSQVLVFNILEAYKEILEINEVKRR